MHALKNGFIEANILLIQNKFQNTEIKLFSSTGSDKCHRHSGSQVKLRRTVTKTRKSDISPPKDQKDQTLKYPFSISLHKIA